MSLFAHSHLRMRYFRPSWQGGDVAQPLCQTPLIGWSGVKAGHYAMTDDPAHVDCPSCLADLARGGPEGRRDRLTHRLFEHRARRWAK